MERARANDEARRTLEERWPRATEATKPTLFLVSAHDPRAGASTKVLITASAATNAERSVREHLGNHWANVHAVPICATTDEVFRQL